MKEAYSAFALSLGKRVHELSLVEKQQAIVNHMLRRNEMDKPKRLQKIEDCYKLIDVRFEYEGFDEWTVYMRGYFNAAEVSEIAKALKAVNGGCDD